MILLGTYTVTHMGENLNTSMCFQTKYFKDIGQL